MLALFRYTLFVVILLLSLLLATPICLLRPVNSKNNSVFFRIFQFLMSVFGGIKIHTEGAAKIEEHSPAVLIGNHQHNFDTLCVSQLFRGSAIVLGKFELAFLPVFGQIYVLCGNALIKRGKRKKSMESMKRLESKILDKKLTVLVFPEGHRNPTDQLLPFKKGAYYTAIRTQTPLIPFSVSQYLKFNNLNSLKMIHVYLKVHAPIQTQGLTKKDIPDLINQTKLVISKGIEELNKNYQSSSLVNK